jgi:hypothetical protein
MDKERPKFYDALGAKCDRFERKGKSMPYTSANGYMFSKLNKSDELGIRFSKEVQEEYFEKFKTMLFKNHGAVIKGYILITELMFQDLNTIVELLNESYDYVISPPSK